MPRWIWRAVLITIGGTLALAAILLIVVQTPAARYYILGRIEQAAQSAGLSFQASSFNYNVLAGRVEIRNLRVARVQMEERPFLAAADVRVQLRILDLIRGSISIKHATLEGIAIDLFRDARGQNNWPSSSSPNSQNSPAQPQGPSALPSFLISQLSAGGTFAFEDRANQAIVQIPGWTLQIQGQAAPYQEQVQFNVPRPGTVRYAGKELTLAAIQTRARFNRDRLNVEDLRVATNAAEIMASGTANGFSDPDVTLNVVAKLDLAPALQFAGESPSGPVSGQIDAFMQARGKLSALEINADIASPNLAIQPLHDLETQASLKWRRTNPSAVEVEAASIRAPEGTIEANATWSGTTAEATNRLSAKIENVDLQKLGRTLNLSTAVASRLDGSLDAKWAGTNFGDANANLKLLVNPLRDSVAKDIVPVTGTITVKAQDRKVTLIVQNVQTMGAAVNAEVATMLNPKQPFDGSLSGTARVGVDELGNLLTNARALLGEKGGGLVAGQSVRGSVEINLNLGGKLKTPTATAVLSGSGIQYGPLRNVALSADASYYPSRLLVPRAVLKWEGAEVRADGSVELQGNDRALSLHATTTEIPIPQVLAVLGKQLPITGRAAVDAQATGTLESPRATLDLSGRDLSAYGEPLGDLKARAGLNNQTVRLESLRLDRPDQLGTLTADGSFQTNTRDYAFQVQGSGLVVRDLQLPSENVVHATVDIAGEGAGNLDNPAANLKLRVQDAEWNNRALGSVSLQAKAADHSASVSLEALKFGVSADGELQTQSPYPMRVRIAAQNTDLSLLSSVRGKVTASVQASGELMRWRDGAASVSVSNVQLETDGGEFHNSGDIRFDYEDRRLKILAATIEGPMSTLSLSGDLPVQAAEGQGIVRYQGGVDLAATGLDAKGQVQIDGDLRGSLEKLTPSGTIRLQDGSISSEALKSPIQGIQLDAGLQNGLLTIDRMRASLGSGSVEGQGAIPLALFPLPAPLEVRQQTAPAKFHVQLNGLSLDSLTSLPKKVNGKVGLTLDAEASRPDLNSIQGTVRFNQLDLDLAGIALRPRGEPTITLRSGLVRVDQFALQGPNSEIQLSGATSISSRDLRDVHLNGQMDAALIGSFSNDLSTGGSLQFDVTAEGKWNQPAVTGSIAMSGGQFGLRSPRLDVTDLNLRASLRNDRIEIEQLHGDMNGGMLAISGAVGLRPQIQPNLTLKASDVYLNVPEGLRTQADLDLTIQPQQGQLALGGRVTIDEGSYTELLDLQSLLQRYLQSSGGVQLAEERNPFLDRLRFNVAVQTRDPVVLDNNLGKLAFTTDLRLVGNYYRPGLTGRINIEEGGTIHLQENDYGIEQGSIDFVNEARIEPLVNIEATTKLRDRTITVDIMTDQRGEISTNFTSDDPNDTRADIVSLLLTGRTAEELQGSELNVAGGEAAASFLAGSVTGRLSQALQGTVGLSQVRIEPDLISTETDPTARLTIGQDLTKALELIYSMNLRDSGDQIWIVRYQLARRFTTQATKQEDNSYRFDFQHDLRFGGLPAATTNAKRKGRRVQEVNFTGTPQLPEKTLADTFNIERGDRYDFFKFRKALDRLESFYKNHGYLEAKIRPHSREKENRVDLTVQIEAGKRVEFVYENWSPPGSLRDKIRDDWQRGAFDTQRIDTAEDDIRRALAKDGYLKPDIDSEMNGSDEAKQITFTISRGKRYEGAELVFDGAKGIEPKTLQQQLKKAKLTDIMETNPADVQDFLTKYYRQEGYLDASVAEPQYRYDDAGSKAEIHIAIQEGPKYLWGRFTANGSTVFTLEELQKVSGLKPGSPYEPKEASDSRDHVEEAYWKKGYRDVVVDYKLTKRSEQARLDVTAEIQDGPQSVVKEIDVKGTDQTSPSFVKKQIDLKPGEVLDYTKTTESRKDLYNTGAFSSVDLRVEPLNENPDVSAKLKEVRLLADVRERTPYQIRYGGFYDTDRGPGAIIDFWNRNSLGGGRMVGGHLRYDGDVHEARAFFSQPLLRNLPLRTDASTFVRREFESTFITDRIGVSVQQEVRLRNKFLFTYGYRFEHDHTYDMDPDAFIPFDESLRVAPLTATLTRDSRDDLLDASRGSFTSHAMEYATSQLGSSLLFVRYFGQYFHYLPLTSPAPIPFGKGRQKPRVVYAGGIRVGLATGLGNQELIPSERFFAGGGTTIRGFKQGALGPVDVLGQPAGGNAVLIVNNELRFPLFKMFDGVGFVDIGNVYSQVSDFDFTDLRKTGGFGLRVRTPYVLIRVDYGVKFDRRAGESLGALFFSIGQAF